jgi:transcription elongation GreA/GreB family factor
MDGVLVDKGHLLREAIGLVEEALQRLEAGYSVARQATLDSPHVMKGKREVSGMEAAYLANALKLTMQEREHELRALRALRVPAESARAALGCVVGIGAPDGAVERLYFLLPVCGGTVLPQGDGVPEVRIITPGTPIAKALLGKSVGDDVTLPTTPPRAAMVRLLV